MLALNNKGKAVKGSNILILGIAYKPNVDDMRESPSFKVMDRLVELGANIEFYDPWIPVIPSSREHMNWKGKSSICWDEKEVKKFDAVIIVTDHKDVDYLSLKNWSDCIIDTRNVYPEISKSEKEKIFKA
jgi:UDP-N-acetyl-D-glucosamine dehydrogenase